MVRATDAARGVLTDDVENETRFIATVASRLVDGIVRCFPRRREGRRHDDAFVRTFTESSSGMGAATDPLTSDTVTSFVVTCARVLTSRGFRSAFSVATARRSRRRRTVVARFGDASRAGDVTAGDRRARVAPRGDPATAVAPDVASVAANISRVSCACEYRARWVTRNSPDFNM